MSDVPSVTLPLIHVHFREGEPVVVWDKEEFKRLPQAQQIRLIGILDLIKHRYLNAMG